MMTTCRSPGIRSCCSSHPVQRALDQPRTLHRDHSTAALNYCSCGSSTYAWGTAMCRQAPCPPRHPSSLTMLHCSSCSRTHPWVSWESRGRDFSYESTRFLSWVVVDALHTTWSILQHPSFLRAHSFSCCGAWLRPVLVCIVPCPIARAYKCAGSCHTAAAAAREHRSYFHRRQHQHWKASSCSEVVPQDPRPVLLALLLLTVVYYD